MLQIYIYQRRDLVGIGKISKVMVKSTYVHNENSPEVVTITRFPQCDWSNLFKWPW